MVDHRDSLLRAVKAFRPSKLLWFWSSISVVVAAIAIGFSWGGWVTADDARRMANEAARKARAELVAEVCVNRYIDGDNFARRFAELKDAVTFKRQDLIEDGHWTELPGIEESIPGAVRLCANELAGMNIPNNPAARSDDGEPDITG